MGYPGSMYRGNGLLIGVVVFFTLVASSQAATISVTTPRDQFGTGAKCSLREAIQAANTNAAFGGCAAGSGADAISVRGGVRYIRALTAIDDTNAGGDYDITSPITITVRGTGTATIDAGGIDRAIQILPGGSLTASRLVITNGYPIAGTQEGGGILDQGKLFLSNSKIVANIVPGNTCSCGGGIAVDMAKATLYRVRLSKNTAANIGGGILFTGGGLLVRQSTIVGNTADVSGGGIEVDSHSASDTMTVNGSTISGNNTTSSSSSNFGGGAIEIESYNGASLKATNVTIADNTSAAEGGGVFSYTGNIELNAATITGNTAEANTVGAGGGGIAGNGVVTSNSIVAGNTDQNRATTDDCFITEGGPDHNLVGVGTGCFQTAPNIKTTNPKLGPLANNGGPTKTIALLAGSPAIGHADTKTAPSYDQRGVKRDAHPDIGAYERK
jgi:CSLREA domain-containing protein